MPPEALDDKQREGLVWLANALSRIERKSVTSDAIRKVPHGPSTPLRDVARRTK